MKLMDFYLNSANDDVFECTQEYMEGASTNECEITKEIMDSLSNMATSPDENDVKLAYSILKTLNFKDKDNPNLSPFFESLFGGNLSSLFIMLVEAKDE